MKLKAVKIKNYKSYCEQDNLLLVDDINTIIGKNESGKSNLIEAISFINYEGIDDLFFKRYNTNIHGEVELSIAIESEDIAKSMLTFKKGKKILVENGLSEYILNNKEFQENLNYIKINKKGSISTSANTNTWHNEIISLLLECDKFVFNYEKTRINNVIANLKSQPDNIEYIEKIKWCLDYLSNLYKEFPRIIKITNDELKTEYLRNEIENDKESKVILMQLLDCLNYNIDDIKNYWNLPSQAEKDDFVEELREKTKIFIEQFNEFYSQDDVQLIPTVETKGLYFSIKTNGKRIGIEERSNGLRWYLNLYIQVKSKIKNAAFKNCVVIMDEPGVYLHVDAQKELRKLFENLIGNENQIIYTTHSPFMIYADKLARTKLIIKDDGGNTHIGNRYYDTPHKIKSKSETLSPMLSAIGMSMNYHLLGDDDKVNIITEGISDYNYIKAYLIQKKLDNKYNIIPSAGVSKVNYLASILIGWNCKIKILLDQDKAGRTEYKTLIKQLAIDTNDIIFADLSQTPSESINKTIEDLFSLEDKNKIGINEENYENEKAVKSLSLLGKVQDGLEVFDEETIKNFDELFEKLFG